MASSQQRYITKVRIENFQSHEDTEFDLSPGINLIVGSSEAGKSAILRAINFALHNEPRGDAFVRMGQDETRVSIWWNDGCYLCRIKGAARNAVLITDKDGNSQGYERIGGTLPPEALAVLGNPPIDDYSGPIAYSDQHQPLFLVTLSSSELPKTISRLTGIDDFEEAAELLNKQANSAIRKIRDSTGRIESLNIQLKAYDDLDAQLLKFEEIETLSEQIDEISSLVSSARRLKTNYDDLMTMGRAANVALKNAAKIAELSPSLLPIQDLKKNVQKAKQFNSSYNNIVDLENEAKKFLKIAESVIGESVKKSYNSASDIVENSHKAVQLKSEYQAILSQGSAIASEIKLWDKTLSDLNKERDAIVLEMKDSGAWCSVCQRPKSMDACV